MNWTLWVIVIILALGSAVLAFFIGDWKQNLGSIALNLVSSYFYTLFVVGGIAFLSHQYLNRPKRFFGISRRWPLQIVISTKLDVETATRAVLTQAEYDSADELRNGLIQQFPGFLASLGEIFGVNVQVPGIVIKGSPLTQVERLPNQGSLILIGGPVRNKVTEFCLNRGRPWVTFENGKFVVYPNRQRELREELADSPRLATIEKLIIDGKVIIIAFGLGENGTLGAVQYLNNEWTKIAKKYPDKPFACLLSINDGQFNLLREFS